MDRYVSGSGLDRTDKECRLDALERALRTEFSDETYAQLKKLTAKAIQEVHVALQARIP